jgi:streptomycin 6-kinase
VNRTLVIPQAVQRRARAAGTVGLAWLAGLERTVLELAHAWSLSIGQTLDGGTEALVLETSTIDGREAVLKLRPPEPIVAAGEFETLLAARGRGYAEVYAYDVVRAAILLERLGPPLATLGLPVDTQLATICQTLVTAWLSPSSGAPFPTGADKARSLGDFIRVTWRELGEPCSTLVIDTALYYGEARARAFDPSTAVLAHGDAHAWNTLVVPGTGATQFKFVDPDGLWIEPAYDLAIPMREWTAELLADDPVRLGVERCRQLSALTGVASEPIWQWGFLERTSTGLLCLQLGLDAGREMLVVAEAWARHKRHVEQALRTAG